mgnify:CR=1 FL=1
MKGIIELISNVSKRNNRANLENNLIIGMASLCTFETRSRWNNSPIPFLYARCPETFSTKAFICKISKIQLLWQTTSLMLFWNIILKSINILMYDRGLKQARVCLWIWLGNRVPEIIWFWHQKAQSTSLHLKR